MEHLLIYEVKMEWKDMVTKTILEDKVVIKYQSDSKDELIAIEDMHSQHLVNAIYKAVRENNQIIFEVHKIQVEKVVWNI
tara:strand:+ start:7179 stop:7418 length:240 start_codon:yes stop_codon:yes gene_type:complete